MKNSTIREVQKLEAAMEANPPNIQWRLCPVRRVQVAWLVDDPHADKPGSPLRQERQLEHYAKKRAECSDESLLAAARTEI